MNNDKLNSLITELNSSQEAANTQMNRVIEAMRKQSADDFGFMARAIDTILEVSETNLNSLVAYYAAKRQALFTEALQQIEEISQLTLEDYLASSPRFNGLVQSTTSKN